MNKVILGGKLEASSIALGCMRMSNGIQAADTIIRTALEHGIYFFDHADIYGGGESERVFGEVLRQDPSLREKMLIQSKCGICRGYYDASKEHILEAADNILSRLGVDYLDTLLLHRPDALMEPQEVAEAFYTLRKTGKVRYFGVSNQNAAQLRLLSKWMPDELLVNQLQFSLAHTLIVDEGINVNVHSDYALDHDGGVLDYCRLHNISIQAWSPFQYGMFEGVFLTSPKYEALNKAIAEIAAEKGVTDSAIAVAWILRHPAQIQTIVGTMNPVRLKEIAKAMEVELTRQEWYRLYLAAGNPLP